VVPILFAAALVGPFPGFSRADFSALASIGYRALIAIGFCQWAWFLVLQRLSVSTATTGILSVPAIALLSSAWILSERLQAPEIVALALSLSAFVMTLLNPSPR
jgi:drug/metabolite transporter (DMT)-like permease